MATVEKRGESYRIVASAGYDREGKQLRKRMTWTPAPGMTARQVEKELERQTVLFEERVKNGLFIEASIRFADYAELWLKNYGEKHLAPKTVSRYKALLVRINSAIGNIRLDRLQPHHISEFLDNLEEDGIKETASFSASVDLRAILKKRGMTRQALADAAGIGISTVYMTCRGKTVAKETAEAICKALNLKFKESFAAPEQSEKLSGKTVLHHYRLISAILNSAVIDDQILVTNPASRVRPPRCEHKEAEYLDEVQAAHLLDLLEGEPMQYKVAVTLLLYTGMRRGELLGLEWRDIDFTNFIVNICRQSQYLAGKGIFTKEPKTESSIRVIKLSAVTVELLRKYKIWQNEYRLSIGDQWENCNRLFTAWNGTPMHPDVLSGWFEDFIKRTDLPPETHIHTLRHTNATLMIAGGEDVLTVSRRLGHAQASTTTNIYGHAIQAANARAAETLQNILNPLGSKPNLG
jgi:integrase